MRILVTFASRHGATREIAAVLARRLHRRLAGPPGSGAVSLLPVHSRPDPAAHDVVVLGSPLYDGRWLAEAVAFAEAHAGGLRTRPLFLFSSGTEVDPRCAGGCPDALRLADDLGARGHRDFAGRLERRLLTREERQHPLAAAPRAGDRRDWARVIEWADELAAEALAPGRPESRPARVVAAVG